MRLRGHHLLCVFGWKGYGYDEKFSKKMDEVFALLRQSEEQIAIDNSPDDLCQACPNLGESGCFKDQQHKEEEIKAHDDRVLEFLGLKTTSHINASDLRKLVTSLRANKNLDRLCIGCSWLEKGYCLDGLLQLN